MEIATAGLHPALVVDSLEIPRFGFAEVLRKGLRFSQVREAANETQALAIVRDQSPALALVILRASGSCTFESIERFSNAPSGTRVLIVSAQDERLVAARALNLGARGVVPLGIGATELLSAIDRIIGGEYYVDSVLMQQLFRATPNGRIEDPVESLSRREIDIFRLLGRGMTAKEISLEVHLSSKTVEYHRQRIKEKLHMGTTADLIRYASMRVLEPLNEPLDISGADRRRRSAG